MADFMSKFSDPDFIRMLAMLGGKVGSEMSAPGTFGKAAGQAAVEMARAGAVSKGTAQQAGSVPPIAPTPAPAPTAGPSPIDAAKHMKSYGKLIEDAFKVDPSLMPKGYVDTIGNALSATPPPVEGGAPTAVAGAFQPTGEVPMSIPAPAPTPAHAPAIPQRAQPLSETLAMTMTPEQVAVTYQHGLTARDMTIKEQQHAATLGMQPTEMRLKEAQARHYDSDTAYKDWERSPKGQEAKYKLASAGVTEAAKADREKHEYLRDATQKYLDANPDIRDKKPEGFPMTIGQLMKMAVENSHAGTSFASILNSTLDYKASVEANRLRMEQLKMAKKDSEDNKTYTEITRNAEILRKMSLLQSPEDFDVKTSEGKSAYEAARILGQIKTPEMKAEMKNLQRIQEQLYEKVGLKYNPLSFLDDTKKDVVTKEDLEKRAADRLKKLPSFNSAPTPMNIFNSNPFYSGGT